MSKNLPIFVLFLFLDTLCYGQELPCDLQALLLNEETIEVRFAPRASAYIQGHPLSPEVYLREGKIIHIPDGRDEVTDVGLRLKQGESVTTFIPHYSCTVTARIDDVMQGLYVHESMYMTGSPFYRTDGFIFAENPSQKNK